MAINFLVSDVQTQIRARFPECSDSRSLATINEVHKQLLTDFPLLRRTQVSTNLTAGTSEYALAETNFHIESVYYRTAAATQTRLLKESIEQLDSRLIGWRTAANGTPIIWYLSSNLSGAGSTDQGVIGLYPPPDTTTTGGYPVLITNVSLIESAVLTGTSPLPPTMNSQWVYVEKASELIAREIRPQMVEAYAASSMVKMQELNAYLSNRDEISGNPNA